MHSHWIRPLAARLARVFALVAIAAPTLEAQLPRLPQTIDVASKWWFWGGGVAFGLNNMTDGRSQSEWFFGTDPLWMLRGGIERSLQDNMSLGVAVSYGDVDVDVVRFNLDHPDAPEFVCGALCNSQMQLWTTMLTVRAGNAGRGFGSTLEGGVGFTGFTNLRERNTQEAIPGFRNSWDFTATLGFGLHYGFSNDFHLSLAQDFGIGFHSKQDLPARAASTFRPRSTRFGLRYGFGSRE